jgi:hypothetical protein
MLMYSSPDLLVLENHSLHALQDLWVTSKDRLHLASGLRHGIRGEFVLHRFPYTSIQLVVGLFIDALLLMTQHKLAQILFIRAQNCQFVGTDLKIDA